ncbi:hypothetical protein KGF54_001868 [Candida jiufengensis]|uniref:uncharacterized protein n=1 Tax=Candida jiufengensis TaxID=497108 RepID=UPI0022245ED8|nr:uncharacterized protein KGF54_001868 [Candida jiufengensis]KAI5955307.1 hypothetical protein KGF54_001868 [Candida jiufengensis]
MSLPKENNELNENLQSLNIDEELIRQNKKEEIKPKDNEEEDDDTDYLPQQSKTNKQRKPQTEEEYQHQLKLWNESGPQINTENWLYEEIFDKQLDPTQKINRVKLLHGCEKAYYNRDWEKCLEICKIGEKLFQVDLDVIGETMKINLSLESRRQRISNKIERHIVDLYNIRQRCLERINQEEEQIKSETNGQISKNGEKKRRCKNN